MGGNKVYLLFTTLILVSCTGNSGRPTQASNEDAFANVGSSAVNDTANPGDALDDLAKKIGSLDGDTTQQDAALDGASNALSGFAAPYAQLVPGRTLDDVRQALRLLGLNRAALRQAAADAQAAGLQYIADLIYDILAKGDVMRFLNTSTGKHYHSTGAPDGGAWKFEGIVFRIYTATNPYCMKPIYRCYLPSGDDHYFALDEACGGGNLQSKIGFLCEEGSPKAFRPVSRLYKQGDHLQSIFQEEIDYIVPLGWALEGVLGQSTY